MNHIGDEGNGRNLPLFNAITSSGMRGENFVVKPKAKTAAAPASPPPKPPDKTPPKDPGTGGKKNPPSGTLAPKKPKPKYPSGGAAAFTLVRK